MVESEVSFYNLCLDGKTTFLTLIISLNWFEDKEDGDSI